MTARIIVGDCLDVMREMEPASVDAIVTDPPYGLGFMGKKWDTPGAFVERKPIRSNVWDKVGGNHNPCNAADQTRTRRIEGVRYQDAMEEAFAAMLTVAKPGAHLLAFGGTRTYHRLTCAIEDAGWEIRDCLGWIYGSGFPKSLDVSKAIDKRRRRDYVIAAARLGLLVPDRNFDDWTKEDHSPGDVWWERFKAHLPPEDWERIEREVVGHNNRPAGWFTGGDGHDITAPATDAAKTWSGWGTALKPSWEPVILARAPLTGTVAATVCEHGTGALNIDGCRIDYQSDADKAGATPQGRCTSMPGALAGRSQRAGAVVEHDRPPQIGRWPANLIHDGSDEVLAMFPTAPIKEKPARTGKRGGCGFGMFNDEKSAKAIGTWPADSGGSAARFFYCAKASRSERGAGNVHPTVKPLALMRYLCRLITPPGGLVLDPFAGSGSTLIAAVAEGFEAVGIEKDPTYAEIARQRLAPASTVATLDQFTEAEA